MEGSADKKLEKVSRKLDKYKEKCACLEKELSKVQAKVVNLRGELQRHHILRHNNRESVVSLRKTNGELKTENKEAQAKVLGLETQISQLKEFEKEAKRHSRVKAHSNHDGKRLPADDVDEMHSRLENLDSINDYVKIRASRMLLHLENVECRGYAEECGTNIILPSKSQFPKHILMLVDKNSHALVRAKVERRKDSLLSKGSSSLSPNDCVLSEKEEAEQVYHEFITTLLYTSYRELQGPVYCNGRKPFYRRSWLTDKNVSKSVMLCDQPLLVNMCFEAADKIVPLKRSMEQMKLLAAKILHAIVNWFNKHSNLIFKPGYCSQSAHAKMIVPTSCLPPSDALEANRKLDSLPPQFDARQFEGPKYGESKQRVERVRYKKELEQRQALKRMATVKIGGSKPKKRKTSEKQNEHVDVDDHQSPAKFTPEKKDKKLKKPAGLNKETLKILRLMKDKKEGNVSGSTPIKPKDTKPNPVEGFSDRARELLLKMKKL